MLRSIMVLSILPTSLRPFMQQYGNSTLVGSILYTTKKWCFRENNWIILSMQYVYYLKTNPKNDFRLKLWTLGILVEHIVNQRFRWQNTLWSLYKAQIKG